ncbi:suppressor of cytokine signaling 6 [Echinops telfairi]|uniref:Suppressor of cytokine signaling 6 n=1 Tax=Echinops telfairi TaxID=9371 RepID=A0ABM0ILZ4_ECHTE|nr:suppressor of cytokine signaling 6 [Echinops telfairi]
MKKISLKTFRKSFNLNKSKDDADFMVVPQRSLAGDFGKEDSLFGSCYGKEMASSDLQGDDEKSGKGRAKSESLMGTLKRRLSAKQKPRGKGAGTSGGTADEDTFSSASAPIVFKDARAQRPMRSTSLRAHHYSPTPWPLRPTASEETCVKVEVRVKALVHAAGPGPALNGVRKDLHAPPEPTGPNPTGSPHAADLRLQLDDRVPVALGLMSQAYLQYTVPLDDGMYPLESSPPFCLDGSSPMEVSAVPAPGGGGTLPPPSPDADCGESDLGAGRGAFTEPPLSGLLVGTTGMPLQSPCAGPEDVPPLSPLLPPMQSHPIQRNFSGLAGPDGHLPDSVRCHLNFDPNSAPGVARVYDSVQSSGPLVVTSLTEELKKLAKQGWYWGPITRWEAEGKLASVPDGSFLVRDSSDDRYLLSLSFRSHGKTLHTRIEHSNGRFSFYEQPDVEGHTSIVDLIEHSIRDSENGAFCYSRSRLPGSATYPVRLTNPVSRFMQVRSLQYLCRFVIRQYTRIDLIQKLPLPNKMKDYLQEKHY